VTTFNLCSTCKHRNLDWTCKAYPEGIPEEIFNGEIDHRKPYKGDNGIIYEMIEGLESEKPKIK
jgi:hypothetical protein